MKSIPSGLAAHLRQPATQIATLWTLTLINGTVIALTDHDRDITIGSVTYSSTSGYTPMAISNAQDYSVDNLEVTVICDRPDGYITSKMVRNGVLDFARIDVRICSWSAPSLGTLTLRRGWLGECILHPAGYFTAELRGLMQALSQQSIGHVISASCRNDLGDNHCGVPISPPVWAPGTSYAAATWVVYPISGYSPDPYAGLIWYTNNGGTSGSSAPNFAGLADLTESTGVNWVPYNSWTKYGTVSAVTSNKVFTVSLTGQPASTLFGAFAGAAGVSQLVQPIQLPSAPFSSIAGSVVYYMTVAVSQGNLVFNTNGLTASLDSYSNTTAPSITLAGTFSDMELALQNCFTWVSGSSGTATLTITINNQVGDPTYTMSASLPNNAGLFLNATMTFITGTNAGASREIKSYSGSVLTAWLNLPTTPAVGDVFSIYPGCDKTWSTCVQLQGSAVNFRGEPQIPGQDFLTSPNLNF